jgi:hypothetical protein
MNRGSLAECHANLARALETSDRADALKEYNSAVELLEPLTATDRSNAKDRIALADALSNAARLYERMAGQTGESAKRVQYWTDARSFYQRSQGLWMELEKTGKLPPARSHAIQEVTNELTRCNDSLAKLEPTQ